MSAGNNKSDPGERQYWAFISYSHRDKAWGDWLHKKLETYKVPKKLVGRPNRTGTVPKRLYPIFRDREELPTSANLGSIIQKGLENSRYLVVICSPKSASSLWVNQEILTFKAMGRSDRVLALIVDGEPNATDKPGQEALECFPEALRYHVNEDGTLSDQPAEPVAGDARPFADGKRNALLKLLAGLLGVDYAILNDREHKRRLRRYLLAATACFLAIATALGIWGVQEQRRLRDLRIEHQKTVEQRNRALRNLAAIYLKEGQQALARRENGPALLRLQASLNSYDTLGARVATGMALPGYVPEVAAFALPHGRLHIMATSATGRNELLLTSGMDGHVRLTRLDSLQTEADFAPAPWVYALAARADGEIITAGMDGLRRMNPKDGGNTLLEKPSCPGCTYALAPDGSLAAVYNQGKNELRVLTLPEGALKATIPLDAPPFQPSGIMSFSPDAKLLAVGGARGDVLVWSLEKDILAGRYQGLEGQVSAMSFNPDSALLAAGEGQFLGGPGEVQVLVWDMTESVTAPPVARLKGHEQQINHLAFSPDGRLLATSSQADLAVRLWDVRQFDPQLFENPLFEFQPLACLPQSSVITAMCFSQNSQLLLLGDIDGQVRTMFVKNVHGKRLPAPDDFLAVAAAQDGSRMALLVPGGGVSIMDIETGKGMEIDTAPLTSAIALANDGSLLAWAGMGQVTVRNLDNTAATDRKFTTDLAVQSMALAPKATKLALAGQGELRVHSLADVSLLASWQAPPDKISNTASVAFSPDGRHVAMSSNFGPVVIDTQSGEYQALHGWDGGVSAVAFAPAVAKAPAMLLAACQDGLVRRWSLDDWQELEALRGHEQLVANLAASSDGALYATSSGSALRLWSSPAGELLHTEKTNLIGIDALHLLHGGGYFAWNSTFMDVLAGENLQRGPLEQLQARLRKILELGLPYLMDRNGELVPRPAIEMAELRLDALQQDNFPWPPASTGFTQAAYAAALASLRP